MTRVTLYKYNRSDGGVTITPRANEYPGAVLSESVRLVPAPGMMITQDGSNLYSMIDTTDPDGWYEVPEPVEVI